MTSGTNNADISDWLTIMIDTSAKTKFRYFDIMLFVVYASIQSGIFKVIYLTNTPETFDRIFMLNSNPK